MAQAEEWVQFGRHGFRFDRIVRFQEIEEEDPQGRTGPDGQVLRRPTGEIKVYYGVRGSFVLNRPEAETFRRFIGDRVRTPPTPEVKVVGNLDRTDVNTQGAR